MHLIVLPVLCNVPSSTVRQPSDPDSRHKRRVSNDHVVQHLVGKLKRLSVVGLQAEHTVHDRIVTFSCRSDTVRNPLRLTHLPDLSFRWFTWNNNRTTCVPIAPTVRVSGGCEKYCPRRPFSNNHPKLDADAGTLDMPSGISHPSDYPFERLSSNMDFVNHKQYIFVPYIDVLHHIVATPTNSSFSLGKKKHNSRPAWKCQNRHFRLPHKRSPSPAAPRSCE